VALELDRKWIRELARPVDDFDEQARTEAAFRILRDGAEASVYARRRGERRPYTQNLVVRPGRDRNRRALHVAPHDFATVLERSRLSAVDRGLDEGSQLFFTRNPDAVEVTAQGQRPLKSGRLFSTNAVRPSLASSDAKAR
jgi:hypothetical protein